MYIKIPYFERKHEHSYFYFECACFQCQTRAVIFAVQTLSIIMLDIAYGCLLLYYFLFIIGFLNTLVCGTNSLLFNALNYSSSYLPIVSRESEVLHIYRKQKKLKCGYIKLTFYGFVPKPNELLCCVE